MEAEDQSCSNVDNGGQDNRVDCAICWNRGSNDLCLAYLEQIETAYKKCLVMWEINKKAAQSGVLSPRRMPS